VRGSSAGRLILAALAFALSTDYGVFLLSRISEARRPGGPRLATIITRPC
jgi:uncharacterized membrane protein YdfJ with MMPL/SSD domain